MIMMTASRAVIVDGHSDPKLAMDWARRENPAAIDFLVEARDEVTRITPVFPVETRP